MSYDQVREFFNSQCWDDIMSQAIEQENTDSKYVMDQLVLRLNSAEFFLKKDIKNRFDKEMQELTNIIVNINKHNNE